MDTYKFLDTVWYEDKIYNAGDEAELDWPIEILRTAAASGQIEFVRRGGQRKTQIRAGLGLTKESGDVEDSSI